MERVPYEGTGFKVSSLTFKALRAGEKWKAESGNYETKPIPAFAAFAPSRETISSAKSEVNRHPKIVK
jgi:hypothetical protein